MNLAKLEKFQAMLPATGPEIRERLGCTDDTVYKWLNHLRDRKMAHIGGWKPGWRGVAAAIYHAGPGEDAPKPKPAPRLSVSTGRTSRAVEKVRKVGESTVQQAMRTQPNSVFTFWQSL